MAHAQQGKTEEPLRIALLVANNRGAAARAPLRYAEQDAGELAKVLVELGGFRSDDVHLVQGQPLIATRAALDRMRARMAGERKQARKVVLLFYYSGHSDGQALELGADRWLFADVRRTLHELGADVRLAIVDSCRSGGLLAEKGGTPGAPFDIRFTDDLATSGEAILTSSAADELALESREIRASFFSHHLISGLRGAADSSGDGRVTLGEAYRHAFVNTLLATSNTLNGPQHPGYDYRLAGKGELVLTDFLNHGARLKLPDSFDQILIADAGRRQLVAELTPMSSRRIALPAGRYVIHGRRAGQNHEAQVELKDGETRDVRLAEFVVSRESTAFIKGDDPVVLTAAPAPAPPPSRPQITLGLGVARGAASALPWLGAARLEAGRPGESSQWSLRIDVATGRTEAFRESTVAVGVAYQWLLRRGRATARAGVLASGGPIVQAVDGASSYWSLRIGAGPALAASYEVVPRWLQVGAAVEVEGVRLRRDRSVAPALWPAAALTVGMAP
jgi:hypothetical protein